MNFLNLLCIEKRILFTKYKTFCFQISLIKDMLFDLHFIWQRPFTCDHWRKEIELILFTFSIRLEISDDRHVKDDDFEDYYKNHPEQDVILECGCTKCKHRDVNGKCNHIKPSIILVDNGVSWMCHDKYK